MALELCLGGCGETNGWEIAGTIATIVATLAALGIPFLMEWSQTRSRRRAEVDERRFNATEILWAADEALDAYELAYGEMKSAAVGDRKLRLQDMGERGRRARQVLDVLLRRQNLTDGMIRCGVDAAELGVEIDRAMAQPRPLEFLLPTAIRARRVAAQVERLAKNHGVEKLVGKTRAGVERAYREALDVGAFPHAAD